MKRSRGSSDNMSAAQIIGSIGSILSLILIHLPRKSPLTFKSVCKNWNEVMSDPYFIHVQVWLLHFVIPMMIKSVLFFYPKEKENLLWLLFLFLGRASEFYNHVTACYSVILVESVVLAIPQLEN